MEYSIGRVGRVVVARLFEGEDLHACIDQIAREAQIRCATVLITGGFRTAAVVVGPEQEKPQIVPKFQAFTGPGEVLGHRDTVLGRRRSQAAHSHRHWQRRREPDRLSAPGYADVSHFGSDDHRDRRHRGDTAVRSGQRHEAAAAEREPRGLMAFDAMMRMRPPVSPLHCNGATSCSSNKKNRKKKKRVEPKKTKEDEERRGRELRSASPFFRFFSFLSAIVVFGCGRRPQAAPRRQGSRKVAACLAYTTNSSGWNSSRRPASAASLTFRTATAVS